MRVKDLTFGAIAAALAIAWLLVAIRVLPAILPTARASATPRPSSAVDVPRLDGKVVVAAGGDLFVIQGGRMAPLATGGDRRDPALSADGTRIAYSLRGAIEGKSHFEGQVVPAHLEYASLVTRPTSGSAEEIVVNGLQRRDPNGFHQVEFETQPAWSPDESQLAFISDNGDGADLRVIALSTKRVTAYSSGKVFADPAWSSDGKTIALSNYTSGEEGTIRLVPVDQRTPSRTLKIDREGDAYRPSFSPDGRWLVVTFRTPRGNDLLAVEVATSRIVDLTTDGKSWSGVFSPDGGSVAFLREHDGAIDLFVFDLGDALRTGVSPRPARQVTNDGRLDGTSRPSWSR